MDTDHESSFLDLINQFWSCIARKIALHIIWINLCVKSSYDEARAIIVMDSSIFEFQLVYLFFTYALTPKASLMVGAVFVNGFEAKNGNKRSMPMPLSFSWPITHIPSCPRGLECRFSTFMLKAWLLRSSLGCGHAETSIFFIFNNIIPSMNI